MISHNFLFDLLNRFAPSGHEDRIHSTVLSYFARSDATHSIDGMNGLNIYRGPQDNPVIFCGHLDEVGLIVNTISEDGFIGLSSIGGLDPAVYCGRRVRVLTGESTWVDGVVTRAATHLMNYEEQGRCPKISELWLDIGVNSKERALELINIGYPVVPNEGVMSICNGKYMGRAMDNRLGCFIACSVLKKLTKADVGKLGAAAVLTAQEETGLRGAAAAVHGMNPKVAVVIDVTPASDTPAGGSDVYGEARLGEGPVIAVGGGSDKKFTKLLLEVAKKKKIDVQRAACAGQSGTDGSVIQCLGNGIPTVLVGIPLRNLHTPSEICDLGDVEGAIKLLTSFYKEIAK